MWVATGTVTIPMSLDWDHLWRKYSKNFENIIRETFYFPTITILVPLCRLMMAKIKITSKYNNQINSISNSYETQAEAIKCN